MRKVLPLEEYYNLNACCISEYVERLVCAGKELTTLISREVETGEVLHDSVRGSRFNFLNEVGNIGWCDNCSLINSAGEVEGDVPTGAGLT